MVAEVLRYPTAMVTVEKSFTRKARKSAPMKKNMLSGMGVFFCLFQRRGCPFFWKGEEAKQKGHQILVGPNTDKMMKNKGKTIPERRPGCSDGFEGTLNQGATGKGTETMPKTSRLVYWGLVRPLKLKPLALLASDKASNPNATPNNHDPLSAQSPALRITAV